MDLKGKAFNNALRTLKALGAEYAVIDVSGEHHVHGDVKILDTKSKKSRGLKLPYGTYAANVKEQGMEGMKVGDVMTFETAGLRAESVRGAVINYANNIWGANSVITSNSGGKVEALRVS